jgi:Amt family ammonium transporter
MPCDPSFGGLSMFKFNIRNKNSKKLATLLLTLLVMSLSPMAMAAETPVLDSGDTAWMLTSTALVLFMTIPGLSLFYAGMVRSKNVLSVMMQCFAITWVT